MKTVLVLEDDSLMLTMLVRVLKGTYGVLTASSLAVAEAALLGDDQIDLVLSDTSLPDGLSHTLHSKLAEQLKARGVAWIAMSGNFSWSSHAPALEYYTAQKILMLDKQDISPSGLLKQIEDLIRKD